MKHFQTKDIHTKPTQTKTTAKDDPFTQRQLTNRNARPKLHARGEMAFQNADFDANAQLFNAKKRLNGFSDFLQNVQTVGEIFDSTFSQIENYNYSITSFGLFDNWLVLFSVGVYKYS